MKKQDPKICFQYENINPVISFTSQQQQINNITKMTTNNQQKQPQTQDLTFKDATMMLREFVRERDWDKYHTPRNLVLALVGQVGEISQIFQWKGEVQNGLKGFSEKEKVHVGQEIADVLSYLIRLADVSGIDIQTALKNKMAKNRKKYPSEQIKQDSNLFFDIKDKRRVSREAARDNEPKQSQVQTDTKKE